MGLVSYKELVEALKEWKIRDWIEMFNLTFDLQDHWSGPYRLVGVRKGYGAPDPELNTVGRWKSTQEFENHGGHISVDIHMVGNVSEPFISFQVFNLKGEIGSGIIKWETDDQFRSVPYRVVGKIYEMIDNYSSDDGSDGGGDVSEPWIDPDSGSGELVPVYVPGRGLREGDENMDFQLDYSVQTEPGTIVPVPKDRKYDAIASHYEDSDNMGIGLENPPIIAYSGYDSSAYLGCHSNVSPDREEKIFKDLAIAGLKWARFSMDGGQESEIVYYRTPSPSVLRGVNLRARSIGVMSPPLSANECYELLKMFGAGEKKAKSFADSVARKATTVLGKGQLKIEDVQFSTELLEAVVGLLPDQQELVLDNLGLASFIARKYYGKGVDWDDLVQVARVGLIRAAKTWDEERGVKFSTYAYTVMRNEISKLLASEAKQRQKVRISSRFPGVAKNLAAYPTPSDLDMSTISSMFDSKSVSVDKVCDALVLSENLDKSIDEGLSVLLGSSG